MKRSALLLVLVLSICLHGYVCWEENGIAIRQAMNLNFTDSVINLSGGGFVLVWSDALNGMQQIKAQRVSEAGENIWGDALLLTDTDSYYPYNLSIKETTDGDVIAAWFERESPTKLRIQRIDIDGNLLWGESGITIELLGTMDSPPLRLVADEEGGIYLVWIDNSSQRNIRALRLDSEGNSCPGWSANGITIMSYEANAYQLSLKAIADGFGGIVLVYKYGISNYVLQRCDSQGILAWGEEGIHGDDMRIYGNFSFFNWSEGEYGLIKEDGDNYWFNSIDQNGQFIFSEWQQISFLEPNQLTNKLDVTITTDGKIGLIYSVIEFNYLYLAAQKIMPGEYPDWGPAGILVDNDMNNYATAQIAAAPEGGIYVNWDAAGDEYHEDLYYRHWDAEGNSMTGIEPISLSSSEQGFYSITNFSTATGAVCVWSQHDQDSDQIKIQIFDSEENPQCDDTGNLLWIVLSGATEDECDLEGNNDHTAICWRDTRERFSRLYLQIVDNNTGEFMFAENGIPVILNSSVNQIYPKICVNAEGKVCITLKEFDSTRNRDIVQVIDLEGNRLLGDDGQVVNQNTYLEMEILPASVEDGFLIVWDEGDGDFVNPQWRMKAQKIVNDQFIWGEGVILLEDNDYYPKYITVEESYICWMEDNGIDQKLKILRIDDDGNIVPGWEGGILISEQDTIGKPELYLINDEILVLWEGDLNLTEMCLYGQKISNQGEFLWEAEGRLLVDNYEDLVNYQFQDGYLYCVKYGSSGYYSLHKYNLNGNNLYSVLTLISDSESEFLHPLSVYEDFVIVYWTNSENDIYAKIYDPEGYLVDNVPADGIAVCIQRHEQFLQSCLGCVNGYNISIWKDYRGEHQEDQWNRQPGLYIQAVDVSLVSNYENEIPDGNLVNLSNYPNPFAQSTTLKCDLPRGIENAEIVIYNIKGQKVRSIPTTSNEVQWDCRNDDGKLAGSGMYFYKLQGNGFTSTTGRMIMLR